MKSVPVHVFYFRGLSTYGADDAKWSFLNFGSMHKYVQKAFAEREVILHPVLGMGVGTLLEMAARAQKAIESHAAWKDPHRPVHFCGHSAGGLIARLVLDSIAAADGKILSLLTFGTPNSGSELARVCIDMPVKFKGSTRVLRSVGYDVARNRSFFEELTRERVALLSRLGTKKARVASVVCHAPRAQYCVPLRLFYKINAFRNFNLESDGIVERDSQPFGEVIGELNIDHFRQIGLFGGPDKFAQLNGVITDFFKTTQRL